MIRGRVVQIVCGLLVVFSCGRATVREERRVDVAIAGVSFDATSVTVLVRHAACASALETVKVTSSDEATRACLRGLHDGAKAELVERRLQFKPMTCGDKPAVTHTLGPCTVARDDTQIEPSGQRCKS